MNQPVHSCLLGLACPVGPPGLASHTKALHKHQELQNLLSLTSRCLMIICPFLGEHYRRTRHSQSTRLDEEEIGIVKPEGPGREWALQAPGWGSDHRQGKSGCLLPLEARRTQTRPLPSRLPNKYHREHRVCSRPELSARVCGAVACCSVQALPDTFPCSTTWSPAQVRAVEPPLTRTHTHIHWMSPAPSSIVSLLGAWPPGCFAVLSCCHGAAELMVYVEE